MVEQLRGVSYDLKDSGKHEIGVIAEEVGEVVPEVVSYEENGKDARGVDYSRLTALLIEAVKQQGLQIKTQQQQIARLNGQVRILEARLQTELHSSKSPANVRSSATHDLPPGRAKSVNQPAIEVGRPGGGYADDFLAFDNSLTSPRYQWTTLSATQFCVKIGIHQEAAHEGKSHKIEMRNLLDFGHDPLYSLCRHQRAGPIHTNQPGHEHARSQIGECVGPGIWREQPLLGH
jgi:Chaperone of endosialidase